MSKTYDLEVKIQKQIILTKRVRFLFFTFTYAEELDIEEHKSKILIEEESLKVVIDKFNELQKE